MIDGQKEIRIKIWDNMSKAEEQKVIAKLRYVFEVFPNNYLASLFTQEFQNWVVNRTQDDFPVDVMEYINDHSKDDEIGMLRNNIQAVKKDLQRAKQDIEVWKERAGEWHSQVDSLEKENHELTRDGDQLLSINHELKNELATKDNELVRLKAKLYDLEHTE